VVPKIRRSGPASTVLNLSVRSVDCRWELLQARKAPRELDAPGQGPRRSTNGDEKSGTRCPTKLSSAPISSRCSRCPMKLRKLHSHNQVLICSGCLTSLRPVSPLGVAPPRSRGIRSAKHLGVNWRRRQPQALPDRQPGLAAPGSGGAGGHLHVGAPCEAPSSSRREFAAAADRAEPDASACSESAQ
jgi:hypothetical protein